MNPISVTSSMAVGVLGCTIGVGTLAGGGCVQLDEQWTRPGPAVDEAGVPARRYLVGDATQVGRYEAPSEGAIVIVEQTTRSVIGRLEVEQGQTVDVAQAQADEAEMRDRLGMDQDEVFRPWMYFVPAGAGPDRDEQEATERQGMEQTQ